jgi:hypothetical protein
MPGILANSASVTMTSPADTQDGFVANERVTLSTSPTGSSYSWGLAKPAGSRASISDDSVAAPTFVPDLTGIYVVTCVVNGTTAYSLRVSASTVTAAALAGSLHMLPQAAASVPTPALGRVLFQDRTTGTLRVKDTVGAVAEIADASAVEVVTMPPKANATIEAPVSGGRLFWSEELDALAKKDSGGSVSPIAELATVAPVAVGTQALGSSLKAAKEDHSHAHGTQTEPTHHAAATSGAAGFMPAADKSKLDTVSAGAQAHRALVDRSGSSLTDRATLTVRGAYLSDDGAGSVLDLGHIDVREFGARGAAIRTTGSIATGSAALTVADGSSLSDGGWVVVYGAGGDPSLPTPGAPTITQQGTPGATTYRYQIAYCTEEGAVSVAGPIATTTTGPATLSLTDYNDLTFGAVPSDRGIRWILVYMQTGAGDMSYTGAVLVNGLKDQRSQPFVPRFKHQSPIYPDPRPDGVASPPPLATVPALLRARIASGGGTNTLTLDRAAVTSVSGARVVSCDLEPFRSALHALSTTRGGRIVVPPGTYHLTGNLHVDRPAILAGAQGLGNASAGSVLEFADGYGITFDCTRTAPTWKPLRRYELGDYAWSDGLTGNPGLAECTTAGTSGTTEPTWGATPGATKSDGSAVWTIQSLVSDARGAGAEELRVVVTGVSRPPGLDSQWDDPTSTTYQVSGYSTTVAWESGAAFGANVIVVPSVPNGFVYRSGGGTSGGSEPTWPLRIGGTVVDGTVTWTCVNVPYRSGTLWTVRSAAYSMRRIHISGARGNAFGFVGRVHQGSDCNNSEASFCRASEIRNGHGFYLEGSDANACVLSKCDATTCDGVGFQDASFLGNTFQNCHANSNGVAAFSNMGGAQQGSVAVACYMEAGQSLFWRSPGIWIGGVPGAGPPSKYGNGSDAPMLLPYHGFRNCWFHDPDSSPPISVYVAHATSEYPALFRGITNDYAADFRINYRPGSADIRLSRAHGIPDYLTMPLEYTGRGWYADAASSLTLSGAARIDSLAAAPTTRGWLVGDLAFDSASTHRIGWRAQRRGTPSIAGWTQNTAVGFGETRGSTAGNAVAVVCIYPGTTGSTEPTWSASIGAQHTDGTAQWEVWSARQTADITAIAHPSEGAGSDLSDGDETINVAGGSWRLLPLLTGNRTKTVGTTGAQKGDQITITRTSTAANTVAVVNGGAGGGTIWTMPASKAAWVRLQFDGTNWARRDWGMDP